MFYKTQAHELKSKTSTYTFVKDMVEIIAVNAEAAEQKLKKTYKDAKEYKLLRKRR